MAEPAARSSSEDRVRAALWFAERGFGVFSVWSANAEGVCRCPQGSACTSPGKHPITKEGFHDATTDPKRIRTLLSAGSEPNYGLVCPDGVFAWDVDGDDQWRISGLEVQYGFLPHTLTTRTANGYHYFYRWPDAYPRPIHKLFGCVTRWGTGKMTGYVIGPRSVHATGKEYVPGDTFDIATFPDAWAAASQQADGATITIGGDEQLPEVGHRHDWLRDKARYYRGFMDSRDTLRAALLAENARLPEPKSTEEVDRAIGDVMERFPLDPPQQAAERVDAKLDDGGLGLLQSAGKGPFPEAPGPAAFTGTIGDVVEELAGGTDASEVALLGCTIAFLGALIPGMAYFHRLQTSSPFVALVGESTIGRKGTAMMRVSDAMGGVFGPEVVNRTVLDGLASGEGLVSTLAYKQANYTTEPTVGMVFEEEYASLLAARSREGSTLDPKMRSAFDGSVISNRRSGESKTVVPPYWLSALIAITPRELRDRLDAGAVTNGSANRWLYLPVVRREGQRTNIAPRLSTELNDELVAARRTATNDRRPLSVDEEASALLAQYSDWLPTVAYGLAQELVKRLGVIAFRVALVHALADRQRSVSAEHVLRSIELTEYARRGIAWVFGSTIGSRDADYLYRQLLAEGRLSKKTITREIIRDVIRQQAAIDLLVDLRLAEVTLEHHEVGRPTTWLISSNERGNFPKFQGSFFPTPTDTAKQGTNGTNPDFVLDHVGTNVEGTGNV